MSRKPIVAAAGLLLLVAGFALAQQGPPPLDPSPILPPIGGSSAPVVPPIGGGVTPPPLGAFTAQAAPLGIPSPPPPAPEPPKAPPPEKTLDQLMDEVEKIRTQKAELEKKEQELVKAIQKKASEQKTRMDKLGVNPAPAMPPIPVVPIGGTTPK